jgi:crotonobetainyl-CoA:carnitine CoA-transferase CaiB-like acyl-CoA transferase
MIDATVATDDQMHYDLEDSEATGPLANDAWETGAGPILISADFRYLWKLLTTEFGMVDPADQDTELADKIRLRRERVGEFMLSQGSFDQIEQTMARMNLAWGRVRDASTLPEQPTIKARGTITQIDDREGGTRPITQSPYRFSMARSGVRGPAPHRGEHNREVLAEWLGYEDGQIQTLMDLGVLQRDEF